MLKKRLVLSGLVLSLGILLGINTFLEKESQDIFITFANWENGIEMEKFVMDKEYMLYMEEYCDNLREEYIEFVDYPEIKKELLPVDAILNYRFFMRVMGRR